MTLLDWLGLGAAVISLAALAALVLWWQVPPARPYVRGALQALSWVSLLGLVPLSIGILTRRRHRRTDARIEPSMPEADRAENLRESRMTAAREEHAASEARTQAATADPDPAAGWAALDDEERRLRGDDAR